MLIYIINVLKDVGHVVNHETNILNHVSKLLNYDSNMLRDVKVLSVKVCLLLPCVNIVSYCVRGLICMYAAFNSIMMLFRCVSAGRVRWWCQISSSSVRSCWWPRVSSRLDFWPESSSLSISCAKNCSPNRFRHLTLSLQCS